MPGHFWTALVACVVVGAVLALGACGDDGGPKDTTREYLEAVADGDGKRACALMTGEFRRVTVESSALGGDSCEESIERASRLFGEEGRSLLREAELYDEGSGARGSAWVRIRGDERTPFCGELVTLREVDDNWKLDSQIAPGG